MNRYTKQRLRSYLISLIFALIIPIIIVIYSAIQYHQITSPEISFSAFIDNYFEKSLILSVFVDAAIFYCCNILVTKIVEKLEDKHWKRMREIRRRDEEKRIQKIADKLWKKIEDAQDLINSNRVDEAIDTLRNVKIDANKESKLAEISKRAQEIIDQELDKKKRERERLEHERIKNTAYNLRKKISNAQNLIRSERYSEAIDILRTVQEEADDTLKVITTEADKKLIEEIFNLAQEKRSSFEELRIQNIVDKLNKDIADASNLIYCENFDDAINMLKNVKTEAEKEYMTKICTIAQNNIDHALNKKNLKRIQNIADKLKKEIVHTYNLINSEKFDDAIRILRNIKTEADKESISEISKLAQNYINVALKKKQQRESDEIKQRIEYAYSPNLTGMGKYDEVIANLEKLHIEASEKNLLDMSEFAQQCITQARSEKLMYNLKQSAKLIESNNYDEANTKLEQIKDEALKYDFPQIVDPAKEMLDQVKMLKSLVQMFRISKRLKIDDICEQLNRSRKEIMKLFFASGEKFGITIDADCINIENVDNLSSMFFESLEKAFTDWEKNEKTKYGKLF